MACQWIWALVLSSLTSEGYPPMVEAMFSTMCTETSSRFPASTSLLYGPLGEALMGLFGKSLSGFDLFFFHGIVWVFDFSCFLKQNIAGFCSFLKEQEKKSNFRSG